MEKIELNKAEVAAMQNLIVQQNQIRQQLTELALDCLKSRNVDSKTLKNIELSQDGTHILYSLEEEKS